MKITAATLLTLLVCISAFAAEGDGVPPFKLWNEVKSPELKELHAPAPERVVLANGMIVFLLEDHELPLIDLTMRIRVKDLYEPPEQVGLAWAMATILRSGGSEKYPGDKLDETLEGMAASIGCSIDSDSGYASLSTLKADFEKGLGIFVDLLRNPAFPQDKLELWRSQARTGIGKRNDSPGSIAGREFNKALYGAESPYARHSEYATVNGIDRAALQAFHQKYFHPNQFILGVYGDFKKDEMLAKLKAAFEPWPAEKTDPPAVAPIPTGRTARTLFVDRPKINQTTFSMGQVVDARRDSPDYPAIQMMNEILSGSMSARLFTEVRTKKGLAYSVWGYAGIPYDHPGIFYCNALTRNEQALEAVDAVRHEVVKLVETGVTPQEVAESRERIINSFVFNFDTPRKIVERQMTYEYFGYPMDFAEKLLEAVKKVTPEDVSRVAKKYIDPEKFVLLGVGNSADLDAAKSFRSLKDVVLLDVAIPPAPLGSDPKKEAEGQRIIADAIKAAGGEEALLGVKSYRADLNIVVNGDRLRGCVRAKPGNFYRVDVAGPKGPLSQILAEEGAWTAVGSTVRDIKSAVARKNLGPVIQNDLGLLRTLAPANNGCKIQALDSSLAGESKLEGVAVELPDRTRVKIWFDAQTHYMTRVWLLGADGMQKESELLFSGQSAFGKLTVAKNVVEKSGDAQQTIELQALTINPELDPALFAKPDKAAPPPE
jgi:predicted Zn-dependent peptidase